ncbi:hypothetical protein ES288_A11G221100v1 [Gossypium darwinii]|uniref:Uncharacterized protein n=1 Tax=Gossypium darwinii TaxID=34276 RepID=A0A5D2EP18_GOSDA|nr:hypothetical protein ES288_A11G221100v1 [Gossypium darwinii]
MVYSLWFKGWGVMGYGFKGYVQHQVNTPTPFTLLFPFHFFKGNSRKGSSRKSGRDSAEKKEPMTPRSDRPTRETKVVERYSAPSVARSSSFKKKEHPFSFSLRLDGCKELMSGMEVAKDQELVDGTVAQESGKSMPSSQQEVLIQALRPKLQELRRKEDAIARGDRDSV